MASRPGGSRRRPARRSPDRRRARPGLRPTVAARPAGDRSPGSTDQGPWTPGQVRLHPRHRRSPCAGPSRAPASALVRRQLDHDRPRTRQPGPRLRQHRLDIGEPGRAVGAVDRPPARRQARAAPRRGDPATLRRRRRADWRRPRRPRPATRDGSGSSQFPCTNVHGQDVTVAAAGAPAPGSPAPRPAPRRWRRWPRGGPRDGDRPVRWPGRGRWRPIPSRRRPRWAPRWRAVRSRPARPRPPVRSPVGGSGHARSTRRSSERKAQCPRTYCSGSPRSPARRQGAGGRRRRPVRPSGRAREGVEPSTSSTMKRASCRAPSEAASSADQLAPGHGAPSSSPASWRARLSAIRASVSSVRSPASTWSSL